MRQRSALVGGLCAGMFALLGGPAYAAASAQIRIEGRAVTIASLGAIRTPTGVWPVDDLGRFDDVHAYRFRYESRPDWWSICLVRRPDGSGQIDDRAYSIAYSGETFRISALPGSMKCADSGEPVSPSIERLLDAVSARRVLPYSRQAFRGWPKAPAKALPRLPRGAVPVYRPDRIYGLSGSYNAIGIVTGQGGEYSSSRGFVSGDDAVLIAAAIDGDRSLFSDAAKRNRVQMLYGLSLPNLAIWSENHNVLRDPQKPFRKDRPYINEGKANGRDHYGKEGNWIVPADYAYLAELGATPGKSMAHGNRDEAHLFNHGYAYWLATGDPRAA
ncbi:hypothetical protein, partial [Sphingosinicella xenopeptidilytica]